MGALKKKKIIKLFIELLMIFITALYLFPVFNLICSSLKTSGDLMRNPIGIPNEVDLNNYAVAWDKLNYPTAFCNTLIICVTSIILIVLIGALAAYPIARFNLRFNKFMYLFFLATIMIPAQATMIPLVRLFYSLGLVNSYLSMIIFYTASAVPFSVFLFTGFIKTIPYSLEEAATIDGCSPFKTFAYIIFPLLKSVSTTVVILNIMWIWNDFMMPMILLQSKKMRTLTPSIFDFFQEFTTQWNFAFAASVLVMIPGIVAFLLLQKHFVEGMVSGGVKS